MYLDIVKDRLNTLAPTYQLPLQSCTAEEIAQLERQIGLTIPAAYREFLAWMGHGAGDLFRGSHCFYNDIALLQEDGRELLRENQVSTPLPPDALVFFMHQGYHMLFFRVSEGDDPPVYSYGEWMDTPAFQQPYSHYSAFLLAEVEQYLALRDDSSKHI